MNGKVNIIGIDTSNLPKLTGKESANLLIKIQQGDQDALDLFVSANLRLVLSLVSRYNRDNINSDDLFQAGCIGLIKAINNFDTTLGVMFSTYAVPMIIGELKKYLRDDKGIKVSRSVRDLAYLALQTKQNLGKNRYEEVSLMEVAQELAIPLNEIACAIEAVSSPISMYEPAYSDGDDTIQLVELIKDDHNTDLKWIDSISLLDGLDRLTEKEQSVLKLRYYIGKTQKEIASAVGISQAQVSRIEKTALSSLKKYLVAQ